MAAMAILRRAILLVVVTLFAASAARAQVEPPPATTAPPAATAPAGPPAAESTAPVAPLSSTLAPEAAPAPSLVLTERTAQEQQAPRPEPFYRKTWFWAAVGVVLVTATLILVFSRRDPSDPPATTFGNMHAF